jgi:hypothetical protein
MKRVLITAALLMALGTTSAALASGAAPTTEKVLGARGVSQRHTIRGTKAADALVAQATVPTGASFGWHHGRAVVFVVYLGLKPGVNPDVPAGGPRTCHF